MGEAIAITSGKGGVGKSSVCINMGMVLAQKGYRVCLIDVDLGLKNLDVMLGLENRVIYDLKDVMEGRYAISVRIICICFRHAKPYIYSIFTERI